MDPLACFIPIDRPARPSPMGPTCPPRPRGPCSSPTWPVTPSLSETLAAADPADAGDRLRHALAPLFATLITHIHAYGGAVLGFAGDAATGWFPGDTGHRAITAAAAIQAAVPTLPPLRLPDGTPHPLALKIVVTAGPVRRCVAGDPAHGLFDVLAGPPLARAALGDRLATGSEILLDEPAAAALPAAAGSWRTDPEDGARFLALTTPPPPAAPAPWPGLPAEGLPPDQTLAWVPPPPGPGSPPIPLSCPNSVLPCRSSCASAGWTIAAPLPQPASTPTSAGCRECSPPMAAACCKSPSATRAPAVCRLRRTGGASDARRPRCRGRPGAADPPPACPYIAGCRLGWRAGRSMPAPPAARPLYLRGAG